MNAIKLKNGTEEMDGVVTAAMMSLRVLFQNDPIVAYELVMKCRDRDHKFFGLAPEVLQKWALLQSDGHVHNSIRNIVLSAVTGDGLKMVLGSPVAVEP